MEEMTWRNKFQVNCPSKQDFLLNKGSLMYFSYMTKAFRAIWNKSGQIACESLIIIIKSHVFLQGCTPQISCEPRNKQPRSDCSPADTSLLGQWQIYVEGEFTVSELIAESKPFQPLLLPLWEEQHSLSSRWFDKIHRLIFHLEAFLFPSCSDI